MEGRDIGLLLVCCLWALLIMGASSGCTHEVAVPEDPISFDVPVSDKDAPEMAVFSIESEVE